MSSKAICPHVGRMIRHPAKFLRSDSDHRYLFPRSDFDRGWPVQRCPAFPGR